MLPPYYKGYEILERNDAKASRSVLRRERASNGPYLVDHFVCLTRLRYGKNHILYLQKRDY